MEYHRDQLNKSCRICGRRLQKAKKHATAYSCEDFTVQLTHPRMCLESTPPNSAHCAMGSYRDQSSSQVLTPQCP